MFERFSVKRKEMKVVVDDRQVSLRAATRILLDRMVSPICGLTSHIGVFLRGSRGHRLVIAGAQLSGCHVLLGHNNKPAGSYHIGGAGVLQDEALIRTLAESAERYCQLVSPLRFSSVMTFSSYAEITKSETPVLSEAAFKTFTDDQLKSSGFPFETFSRTRPLSWMPALEVGENTRYWVPAQCLLVGYGPRRDDDEPWISPAVTTGTAAHTSPQHAFLNALLELAQLDSVMGHWCSGKSAPEIIRDARTEGLNRYLDAYCNSKGAEPKFYWLQNPDLPGTTVACIMRDTGAPSTAIGVGIDFDLPAAMQKAFVEAAGVLELAKYVMYEKLCAEGGDAFKNLDPNSIYDLDSNVMWYALPENRSKIDCRFGGSAIKSSALPVSDAFSTAERITLLVSAFGRTRKRLFSLNLTTTDVAALGLTVARVWSPDTLSLSLPSALPLGHIRLASYGGANAVGPHPYP